MKNQEFKTFLENSKHLANKALSELAAEECTLYMGGTHAYWHDLYEAEVAARASEVKSLKMDRQVADRVAGDKQEENARLKEQVEYLKGCNDRQFQTLKHREEKIRGLERTIKADSSSTETLKLRVEWLFGEVAEWENKYKRQVALTTDLNGQTGRYQTTLNAKNEMLKKVRKELADLKEAKGVNTCRTAYLEGRVEYLENLQETTKRAILKALGDS